jgi:protein tyrosine phosphatase (PTP) superfamily phosphohydrolase (DUF442 family)
MKTEKLVFAESQLYFLCIWLFNGFFLGTITLLFPVRWWATLVRNQQWDSGFENVGVILLIILLIVVSFRVSRALFRWQLMKKNVWISLSFWLIPFAFSLLALALLLQPNVMNGNTLNTQLNNQFVVGAYPDEAKIKQLKKEGYTAIISLLHPAVVPFEPMLLQEEKAIAKKYNLTVIETPMLPWVSNNAESLKRIESIARSAKGKYYIHCYLGKDRVNLVKKHISAIVGSSAVIGETTHRSFEEMGHFERGDLYKIGDKIYLSPYPTNEEFLAFFLAGSVKSVVNLMDSTSTEQKGRIVEERKILQNAGIHFSNLTVNQTTNTQVLTTIIDSVLHLPKPIVIHHWQSNSVHAIYFINAFKKQTQFTAINLNNKHASAH